MMRIVRLSVVIATAFATPASAQDSVRHVPPPPPLFRKHQLIVGAAAVAATIALRPLDERVNFELQQSEWQDKHGLNRTAGNLAFLGGPGPFLIGASLISVGAVAQNGRAIGAGVRVGESVLLAAAIDGLAKGLTGRALPDVQAKHAFSFGRGFHDDGGANFVSFPSGHTGAAFALATSLSIEADQTSPALGTVVRPIAFVTAVGVGAARLYQHVHWLSDLPLGAAIGMWSASTIESRAKWRAATKAARAESHPIQDFLRGVMVAPTRGGVAIAWASSRVSASE